MKRVHRLLLSLGILAAAGVIQAGAAINPATTLNQTLNETATTINQRAVTSGDQAVAASLSDALLVDPGVLEAQRAEFDVSWGDLLVAHELSQASRTRIPVDRIFDLRSEGMSWGQILATLRIPPATVWNELQRDLGLTGTPTGTNGTGTTGGNRSPGTTNGQPSTDTDTDINNPDINTDTNPDSDRDLDTDGSTSRTATDRNGIDRKLSEQVRRLESEAGRRGDQAIADRLASEVGVSAHLLMEQLAEFDADWGDLLIAYTITSRSRTSITVGQVMNLRENGMSWFQIARSLKIPPGQLMRLVRMSTSDLIETTIARSDTKGSKSLKQNAKRSGSGDRGGAKLAKSGGKASAALARTSGTTAKLKGATMKASGAAMKGNGPTAKMGGSATKMAVTTKMTGTMARSGGAASMRPTTVGPAGGQAMRIQGGAGRGHGRR
jgi:hypothetical protein